MQCRHGNGVSGSSIGATSALEQDGMMELGDAAAVQARRHGVRCCGGVMAWTREAEARALLRCGGGNGGVGKVSTSVDVDAVARARAMSVESRRMRA